jgi:hypothetical protein
MAMLSGMIGRSQELLSRMGAPASGAPDPRA